jgi:hypothetical protein
MLTFHPNRIFREFEERCRAFTPPGAFQECIADT